MFVELGQKVLEIGIEVLNSPLNLLKLNSYLSHFSPVEGNEVVRVE